MTHKRRRDRFRSTSPRRLGFEGPLPYSARRPADRTTSTPETLRSDKGVVRVCRLVQKFRFVLPAEEVLGARHVRQSERPQHIRSGGKIVQTTERILKT